MLHIEKFFKKFFSAEAKKRAAKKSLALALQKHGIIVDEKNITFTGMKAFLSIPPAKKTAVFLKKEKVVRDTNELAGRKVVSDIF